MFNRFRKDIRGASAVEFALLIPIFLIMLISGFEVGRYVMIMNKLQSAGFSLATIISQTMPANTLNACSTSRLNDTTLQNIVSGMNTLMQPHADAADATKVIVTSMVKSGGTMRIVWQKEYGDLGDAQSTVPGAVTAEAGILQEGENMLALEAFFKYEPIFPAIFGQVSDTFTERTLAKRVYFYNRLGKAIYLPPTVPVDGEIPCGAGGGA